MSKMYKLLLAAFAVGISFTVSAQENYWSSRSDNSGITTDKAVLRQSFPKEFKLFNLNIEPLKQKLFSVVDRRGAVNITLPNNEGNFEQFEVYEASNFESELQAMFPQIRAFSGKSLTDGSLLKISYSPQGIQTTVFRNGIGTEIIEPYSADHTVYAVFKSDRGKNRLPWSCSAPEHQFAESINENISFLRPESSAGQLKKMRLAQSCTGEYANFFGASTAGTPADEAIVLTAYNNTLTRCNGVYEKDLAIHLNLIASTTAVIFYNPATDPYATVTSATAPPSSWNSSLQSTLTSVIGEANYDIGHLFGASGGGGNAGCIGCVCVDGQKGSGITSPATGSVNPSPSFPPAGDGFDIDYVVHEVGHQMGAWHTFTHANQGNPVQKEVGSGITIMGYAGITGFDVAPHSIDIYHEASIDQIQTNLATKSCPVTTSLSGINATPVVAPLSNYTIPISTPFALTGSATDADAGDVLTYCWEQNDLAISSFGSASIASPTKTDGPNWLTFPATTSPTKLFPRLSTILTGASTTGPLPGGDAGVNIEALSSVSRTLNFRLTVRDNRPYNGTAVGQTNFQDMVVTVSNTGGPFLITTQNTATSWEAGSNQTISWSVNNTTAAPFNCANVKILLSTDGGNTFPIELASSTANDGTENIVVPMNLTTTGRIKVEAIGNIFFDINNASITITPPPNGFSFNSPAAVTASCPAPDVMTSGNLTATWIGTFTGDVSLSGSVSPAGPSVSFGSTTLTQASPSTTVSLTGMSTLSPGNYTVTVTGTGAGAPTQTRNIVFTINPGSGPAITTQPANQSACFGSTATFSVVATGTYQWQVNTGSGFANISGATSASYTTAAVTTGMNGYLYQCIVSGQCGSTTSSPATLTVNTVPAVTAHPVSLSVCAGSAVTFSVTATGSGLTYQWQENTGSGFVNIASANAASYNMATTTVGQNGYQYRCIVSGTCTPPATSNAATLNVSSTVTVTTNPSNSTVCELTNTSFTVAASGTGLTYQWQVSTDGGTNYTNLSATAVYGGVNAATLTLTAVPYTYNTYRYRCVVSSGVCTPGVSAAATLTVNTLPNISAHPANATICEGAGNTFSVTATTGIGALTYQWQLSTNGGTTWANITGATAATYAQASIPAGQNGYRFRVIVTAGCGSVTSNVAILTVNTYPVITFGDIPATICVSDGTVSLPATPAGGTWSGSGVTGSIFTPSAAGIGNKSVSYSVTNAGCTSNQSKVITVLECAERHRLLTDYLAVFVYPVPNNGNFSIRMNTDLYKRLGVRVFGADGRMYHNQVVEGIGYGSVIPVDLSRLASGTYSLHLYNDEKDFIFKGVNVVIFK